MTPKAENYYSIATVLLLRFERTMTESGQDNSVRISERTLPLVEFVRGFMEYATAQGCMTFPAPGDILWHILMYEMHTAFPEVESFTGYDWDGPYPKKRTLGEVFFALMCSSTMFYPTCRLKLIKTRDENTLALYYPFIAAEALAIARNIPGFFEE